MTCWNSCCLYAIIAQDSKVTITMLSVALLIFFNPIDFVENVPLGSNPTKTCGGYGDNIMGKTFPKVEIEVIHAQYFNPSFQ